MKTIQKEDKIYRTAYVATDGTEFDDAEECKKYEKSAVGILKGRVKKMSLSDVSEDDLFNCGSCDNRVLTVVPSSMQDVDTIKQLILAMGGSESYADRLSEEHIGKIVFVTIGYQDCGAWFDVLEDIAERALGENIKVNISYTTKE